MTIRAVRKRDGSIATFKRGKITKAIFKAAYKVGELDMDIDDTLVVAIINKLHETDIDISESEGMIQLSQEIYDIIDDYDIEEQDIASISTLINMLSISDDLANQVVDTFDELGIEEPTVDEIQNTVERLLIKNGHAKTAKVFIVYSARRQDRREMNNTLMKTFEDLTFADSKHVEVKRENANIDGDSAMGTMLRYGSEGAKQFNLARLVSDDIADAHRDGDIHIHDLDFYSLTETCCQIDLDKLFTGGFNTGHGYLREPSEIRSYAALACIAIQSNQNDMHKRVYV